MSNDSYGLLKQLEYLLQDIDEKTGRCPEYYRDYMDEAGISEFASVDGLLDVPRKLPYRFGLLNDDSEEQNEFSEQGVSDSRWESQNICRISIRRMTGPRKKKTDRGGLEGSSEGRHQMMSVQSGRVMTAYSKAGKPGNNLARFC
ncbi:MAG: hypothetical protein ACLSFZ_00820 [Frisingicoccus sp.]